MGAYARIRGGVVVETFSPPAGFELSDCLAPGLATQFVTVPSGVTGVLPGWTYAAGAFAPPAAPAAPSLAQQAQALIAGGIAITSRGTPALDATYSTDAQAQQNILGVQVYVAANGKFPGSSGAYAWLDAGGAPHVFPSVTEFTAFASAVADFVADCTMIALTGAGALPPPSATIP